MKKLLPIGLAIAGMLAWQSCSKHKADATIAVPDPVITARPGQNFDFTFNMGVNLNEQAGQADMNDLADTKTKWVRSFIDFIPVYKSNSLNTDANVVAYTSLKAKGYKTVLNLKFDFVANTFPAVNSADWNNYIAYIDKMLDKVMPYTDILVVGNEPFIEANTTAWDEPLNSFYKAACDRVYNYFKANKIDKPIFLGAFDNLYMTSRTGNAGVNNLFSFIKNTAYLSGADVHIHHTTDAEMNSALTYASNAIRADQKIMVTEFSPKNYYKSYNATLIDQAFIAAAKASTTDNIFPPPAGVTQNYQYIDYALKNPRPADEWYSFWKNSAYLEAKKNYICTSYGILKSYSKVTNTFYALRQSYGLNTDFTATTDPWVMNALFLNRSVQPENGRNMKSYSFLDQFLKATQGQNPCQ